MHRAKLAFGSEKCRKKQFHHQQVHQGSAKWAQNKDPMGETTEGETLTVET